MKKTMIAISALAMAAILAMAPTAANYAKDKETDKSEPTVTSTTVENKDSEDDLLLDKAVLNDELVYVFTGSDGTVNKVMDSVWIEDGTEKEKESNKDYDLPVGINVKYYLDGKEVKASDLKGKSGHLKIKIDYENKKFEERLINGKKEKIYVPFATVAVTVLDDERFENVTVSKGRVIYDGNRYAVTGFAFPGLYEDLGKSLDEKLEEASDKFTKADSLTIEADVKDCDYPGMYMIVSNSIFNELKLDSTEDLDKLKDDLTQVNDAMDRLMDGSSKLYDGLGELLDGADKLENGVDQLANGLDTLSSNSAALNDGAKQVFDTLLATATSQLKANNLTDRDLTIENYSSVIDGAIVKLQGTDPSAIAREKVEAAVNANQAKVEAAVTEAVRAEVSKKVDAAVEATVSGKVEAAVSEQVRAKVEAAVKEEVEKKVTAAVEAGVKQQVAEGIAAAKGITVEQAMALAADVVDAKTAENMKSAQVKAMIEAKTSEQMESAEVKKLMEAKVSETMSSEDVKALIETKKAEAMGSTEVKAQAEEALDQQMSTAEVKNIISTKTAEKMRELVEENYNSADVQNQIAQGNADIVSGIGSLKNLKAQLDAYNEFYKGIVSYTNGVDQAAAGADTLKVSMPELVNGITKLHDGEGELKDGIVKFNDEGVGKLNEIMNDNIEGLSERFDAISDVSKNYSKYADEDGMNKEGLKFIYKISGK